MNTYITHICIDTLPIDGLKRVWFYTQTEKSIKKDTFFWGKGNNEFTKETINTLILKEKIKQLEKPIILENKKTVWINNKGEITII